MSVLLPRPVIDALGGGDALNSRITDFQAALAAHRLTEGVAAPVEDPLVESLARSGEAWAAEPAPEAPPPPAEPEPGPMRKIAALAFRRRLGPERLAAITIAAAAALRADPPDATLQVMLDNLTAARFVTLDDAETVAGLQHLRNVGLLDEDAMAAAIADGQPGEEPV
ncbi:hypothetical protein [Plastoroseomonas hellenica]|uniref:hypothetical protein n=1 Tax=Plastoroseomonas hellenica TaxID=2687306 RepID=UPI001BA9739E|nr:hypothetical protein [Plastoroseomonas hellenica]MBR0647536.1 hypothetical protein [Plastoroseomonas hellenica]